MAAHEGLAESLGAFQLRCSLGGAEDAQAVGAELVHHPCSQRGFGADHREGDLLGLGPDAQFTHVRNGHIFELGVERRAAIAWGHVHLRHLGRLAQLPGHCVFTAAATNHEYFHRNLW